MRTVDRHLIVIAGLLSFVGVAVVCQPTSNSIPPGPPRSNQGEGGGAPPPLSADVLLEEFLPVGHVRDASIDYTGEVRAAAAAAANGVLRLPDFPVLVSRSNSEPWCVRLTDPTTIEGTTGSALVVLQDDVQVLRAEGVHGIVLRNFQIVGTGGDGAGLAHGLIQITGGSRVVIEGMHVLDADADGIAVASAEDVSIVDCRVENASKAAIYVNSSRGVQIRGNTTTDFGGHRTPSNDVVGVGIQISSNAHVICTDNIVETGIGIGILCNALQGRDAPVGNVVSDNLVHRVTNPSNMGASSGIRLANGAAEKLTQTVVRGNSIRACGSYGIYVENHDAALVQGNSIVESERAGILVSTVRDALIANNMLLNSGTSGDTDLYEIQLINGATGVVVLDNGMWDSAGAMPGTARDRAYDGSQARTNELHPRRVVLEGPPTDGQWFKGDVAFHPDPRRSGPVGWICYSAGEPGAWRPFGE